MMWNCSCVVGELKRLLDLEKSASQKEEGGVSWLQASGSEYNLHYTMQMLGEVDNSTSNFGLGFAVRPSAGFSPISFSTMIYSMPTMLVLG